MSTTADQNVGSKTLCRAIKQVERVVRTKIKSLDAGDAREVSVDELVRAVPGALDRDVVRVAMGELATRASHLVRIERQHGETVAWQIEIAEDVDR